MARRRYRKNPIDQGVNDFFGQIESEADMCNVPLKLIVIGRTRMQYTIGAMTNRSIVIQPDICLGVLSNLAVIAYTINYVLTHQEEDARFIDINSLSIIFEKNDGPYSANLKMNDDFTEVGTLIIHKLLDLRNMTSIKNMLTQALKAESLGLARVPSLVNKGIREVRERIFSLSSAVIDGSVTWATQPDGPTDDEILNNVVDHVDEAQTQTNEALDSEDVEELVEAQTAIEAALDDVDMLQDLSEDSELNQELNDTYEDLNARLQEIQDQIQDVERDLFGDEVRPSAPTRPPQSPQPERTTPIDDPSQMELDFSTPPPPPPARAWSFSQTDAGVTAVSGPRGDVKNVMSTLQAKIDQYAADEQLYGISVTFKVEEKSTGSVSASRKGKTITIKVNGVPSISDLINAVSTPLAAIYDEQDIDFDEDGLSLAQELQWS